jgi:hypothetical protein
MVTRGTKVWQDLFDRAQEFAATPGMNGWTVSDTSASGTPTYLAVTEDGGAAKLTLAATSEAEEVTLFHNDVLAFDIRNIKHAKFVAQVSGIDSVTTLCFGLASARNATPDSVAVNAWFRMQGSASLTAVVAETDDATTDNDDKATGYTLANVYKTFLIDFTNGLNDVRFYIEGERVAAGTTFNLSAVAAGQNVQPYITLQKASGTGAPSVTIALVEIAYNYAYGV